MREPIAIPAQIWRSLSFTCMSIQWKWHMPYVGSFWRYNYDSFWRKVIKLFKFKSLE